MNSNATGPKKRTADLIVLITKNTDILFQQTQTKTQEAVVYKFEKPWGFFTPGIPLSLLDR